MFATATPVNEPTIRDLIEQAEGRGCCGLADELPGLAEWTDAHDQEPTDAELDYLMAKDAADRSGHPVYRVTSPGFPVTFESARDGYVAIRQARQRWARGGTSFRAEQVTLARRAA